MTDILALLDETILDDSFTLNDVCSRAMELYGININNLFCLLTGKPIGSIHREELLFALAEEASDDLDDIVDAMLVRVIASMRPSPALNKPDIMTLRSLATRQPVDAMAYLVNRLHGTRDLLTKRDGQSSFAPLLSRIQTYERLSALKGAGLDLTPWLHWLLEIDSKMNLHDCHVPRLSLDRLNRWIVTRDGTSIFELLTIDNAADMLKIFESWVRERLGDYGERDKRATAQANWTRGNRMTAPAYVRSWLENPEIARRATDNKPVNQPKANGRPQSDKTKLKNAKLAAAMSVLSDLTGGTKPMVSTPAPKPVGRLKLNLLALKRPEGNS